MRRKEPFIARMMLLSELKADNDSVIMAHCEYLSWKDLGKMNRHCWFVKTEQLVFGLQKHSELSTTFLFKIFPKTRYFFESYIEHHHCKKFLKWSACLIFTPEIHSLGSFSLQRRLKLSRVSSLHIFSILLADATPSKNTPVQSNDVKY